MVKKIILCIVAATLLISAEKLIAQQETGKPKQQIQEEKGGAGQKQECDRKIGKKGLRSGRKRPGKNLLNELTKAYEANDREKMGKIIEKMRQRRQQRQEIRTAQKERRGHWRKRLQRWREHGRAFGDDFGLGRWGFWHRGMGWPSRRFHDRGWQRPRIKGGGLGLQHRSMGRCRPPHHSGMGWPSRGFHGKGMGQPGGDFRGAERWDW